MSRFQAKSFKVMKANHKGQRGKATRVGMWPSRVIHGFTKILLGFFSLPSRPQILSKRSVRVSEEMINVETPKRSCSSNLHPLDQHYNEAIADCVEFFNKSSSSDIRLSMKSLEELV
ncbi:hypothetical protein LUZ60_016106 [Juncus effusus]|nr:hypothetical protein LUZ60_016106 [Juncus effusus]